MLAIYLLGLLSNGGDVMASTWAADPREEIVGEYFQMVGGKAVKWTLAKEESSQDVFLQKAGDDVLQRFSYSGGPALKNRSRTIAVKQFVGGIELSEPGLKLYRSTDSIDKRKSFLVGSYDIKVADPKSPSDCLIENNGELKNEWQSHSVKFDFDESTGVVTVPAWAGLQGMVLREAGVIVVMWGNDTRWYRRLRPAEFRDMVIELTSKEHCLSDDDVFVAFASEAEVRADVTCALAAGMTAACVITRGNPFICGAAGVGVLDCVKERLIADRVSKESSNPKETSSPSSDAKPSTRSTPSKPSRDWQRGI